MAEAMLRSLLSNGAAAPDQLLVSDPSPERRELAARLGAAVTERNEEVARASDVVLLAVKPDRIRDAAREISGDLPEGRLVISLAPGITTESLGEWLGSGSHIIRVMPNTPCLVGEGASAFCRGAGVPDEMAELARRILGADGYCEEVPEKLMNAVTGLSGSGPAYVCLVIEALADGGVNMGLSRATALALATQTVLGAAKLVRESGEHPAVWKDRVATPGGTTIAGLAALEAGGLRSALMDAVAAATRRGDELGAAAAAPNPKETGECDAATPAPQAPRK